MILGKKRVRRYWLLEREGGRGVFESMGVALSFVHEKQEFGFTSSFTGVASPDYLTPQDGWARLS